ncbi:MAG: DUF2007 domain-containing protein [Symploca sp. SIO3C6]|uniref:DUF2007 domain-containing protein n=1 Tax=Symploca sp. SIO1C4 TaxID=2607765 RepID=A0A6B3N5X1_9CYAN|nr:DUF2007 domain-containing protein [Symploca sp. SIO3C6]NEO97485.1 DUF2007 domain-containing protein [Symploca sp. SIO2E9]NER28529.1 DUF2007 domain-containing protein [Symploca sp. SIO1C4]NET04171.1 DUF2007 domain-containing protein [Symploca sp. SIO2B6]NET52596.1 DUF2007 domain-containing protein [Merismopedia sp. SIO2A8]
MYWITIRTTNVRWEAELMQQVLAAHEIPSRIIDTGISSYFGAGSSAALQVQPQDQWTALLLLSPPEEEPTGSSDKKN